MLTERNYDDQYDRPVTLEELQILLTRIITCLNLLSEIPGASYAHKGHPIHSFIPTMVNIAPLIETVQKKYLEVFDAVREAKKYRRINEGSELFSDGYWESTELTTKYLLRHVPLIARERGRIHQAYKFMANIFAIVGLFCTVSLILDMAAA